MSGLGRMGLMTISNVLTFAQSKNTPVILLLLFDCSDLHNGRTERARYSVDRGCGHSVVCSSRRPRDCTQ